MKLRNIILSVFLLASHAAHAQTAHPVAKFNRVVWVWLENSTYSQMIQQKYVKSLMSQFPSVRFTQFFPQSKITQANAVTAIAGTQLGIQDNALTKILSPTVLDLLESKNVSFKVYAEDFPGACYLGEGTSTYKRYRVPFLSIARVQADRYECTKISGQASFFEDLKYGTLPRLSVLIPNLPHGGAGTNASAVDANLKTILDPLVTAPDFLSNTTVMIMGLNLDSVPSDKKGLFGMILGSGVQNGSVWNDTPYSQINFLKTLEDGFDLGNLSSADGQAIPMVGFWK